jgi:alpha-tubulin suppressor-like RCC1 family protein
MRFVRPLCPAVLALALTTASCGGGGNGNTGPDTTVATVTVSPPTLSLYEGQSAPLSAAARTSSGSAAAVPSISWSTTDAAVATVDAAGVVSAKQVGTTAITATVGGVSGSTSLIVRLVPVASIALTPATATLTVGAIQQLVATLRDSAGGALAGRAVAYSTSEDRVATVAPDGRVTAVGAGTATITATSEGKIGTAVVTVIAPLRLTSVSVGEGHACGLISTGASYCWGANFWGQLGEGSRNARARPTPVAGGLAFSSITAGYSRSCGLTAAGAAYCWGSGQQGEIGDEYGKDRETPSAVSGGLTFSSLSFGPTHTCGLTPSGAAYCWGSDYLGKLGIGNPSPYSSLQYVPAPVVGGMTFARLAAGDTHTCGLTRDGAAYCWGEAGLEGDGAFQNLGRPIPTGGGHVFTDLVAGRLYTCGLTTAGETYCWGWVVQQGDTIPTRALLPTLVPGGQRFVSLAGGYLQMCGLTAAHQAYCWGQNLGGSLGDGTLTDRQTPTPVAGGISITSISIGRYLACGMSTDNDVYCWGENSVGQVGDGTTTRRLTPTRVLPPTT